MRAVRDGHAMRGTEPAKMPTLHRAGKPLADRDARHVDELARHIMIGGDESTDRKQSAFRDAELSEFRFGLHLGHGKMSALRLADIFHFARPCAELHSRIAVFVGRALRNDLTILKRENGDWHVLSRFGED